MTYISENPEDRNIEEREAFRKNLNNLMRRKNVRQIDICKELEIPVSTLNDWTAGVRPLAHFHRIMLAKFFNLQSSDMLFTNDGIVTHDEIQELKKSINMLKIRNYVLEGQLELPFKDVE